MKENAMQRLNEIVKKRGPLLAGLDPEYEKIYPLWKASDGEIEPGDYKQSILFSLSC